MNRAAPLVAAGIAMWDLVERYTGRVGYKGAPRIMSLGVV